MMEIYSFLFLKNGQKKNMDDSDNQSTLEYKDDFWI